MMNRLLLFFLLFFSSYLLQAQQDLKGQVVNKEQKPIPFATVVLMHPKDSIMKFFGITNQQGFYELKRVKEGDYLMQFSFSGMKTQYQDIRIPLANGQLAVTTLEEDPRLLNEVIVEAELVPIRFKTDTIEYNAKAFKTREGAAVEELLEQLPGIEVDKEGNVNAQGEAVVQVLVDGKEFFGKDPKVATKNLPAKAIDKVQVLDRKSEQALFTGIEDGERDRTINLVLKKDHKRGYFGSVKAGVGTNSTYIGEAKVYRFSDQIQAAVLGLANNINQFGFTYKGNNTFGQDSKGVNNTLAGGLNLSYFKENSNRYFASFLGNSRKRDLAEQTFSQNFLEDLSYTQDSYLVQDEKDQPSDINLGLRHQFNEKHQLIMNADISLGSMLATSETLANSMEGDVEINRYQNNTTDQERDISMVSNNSYSVKLKGDALQLATNFGITYQMNDTDLDWINMTTIFDPAGTITVHQSRADQIDRTNLYLYPTLTHKINDLWSTDYGLGWNMDLRSLSRSEGVFDEQNENIEIPIPDFNSIQTSLRPSFSLRRATTKTVMSFTLAARAIQFQKDLSDVSKSTSDYLFFTPRLVYRHQYRTGRRIEFRYNTSTNFPNPTQLFPVKNYINQLNVYQGNIDLRPEFVHNVNLLWSVFDEFSFTSFFIRLMGVYTQDKIDYAVTIDEQLIQTTMPVNTRAKTLWSMNADYSTPIQSLGINYQISLLESWSKSQSFVNDEQNETRTLNHSLTMSLENRNKEKYRLNLGATVNLTQYDFSISDIPDDQFFNLSYFSNLRYTPNKKWNFTAAANVTSYNAQSFDESVIIPLLTTSLSYSFLQAEKATISLTAFDLLNKYTGIERISTANYLTQSEWNTIGRYLMLTWTYQFR